MNILLVEPNRILAQAYVASLHKNLQKSKVVWSVSADAAVSCLSNNNFDLVVLELHLVGHNGVEFLQELRSYSDWQSIPVILHTNTHPSQLPDPQSLTDQYGVVALLYKPVTNLKTLARICSRVLEERRETV